MLAAEEGQRSCMNSVMGCGFGRLRSATLRVREAKCQGLHRKEGSVSTEVLHLTGGTIVESVRDHAHCLSGRIVHLVTCDLGQARYTYNDASQYILGIRHIVAQERKESFQEKLLGC